MTERDRGMAIAMLAEGFGVKDLTSARIRIYEQALQKVPAPLLEPMVHRALATRKFFPKVAELLDDAEHCRLEMRALRFERCPVNEGCTAQGFVERVIDGVRRMVRCRCWETHQERVQSLGVTPLALSDGQQE